jgi:hypothetical protein
VASLAASLAATLAAELIVPVSSEVPPPQAASAKADRIAALRMRRWESRASKVMSGSRKRRKRRAGKMNALRWVDLRRPARRLNDELVRSFPLCNHRAIVAVRPDRRRPREITASEKGLGR